MKTASNPLCPAIFPLHFYTPNSSGCPIVFSSFAMRDSSSFVEASFFSSIARVCRITGGPVSRPVSGIKFAGREGQSPCHHEFPRFLSSSHHGFSSTPFLEAEQCRLCKRWPPPDTHPHVCRQRRARSQPSPRIFSRRAVSTPVRVRAGEPGSTRFPLRITPNFPRRAALLLHKKSRSC